MKHRPKDLLETLTTGEDKVAKVNALKADLKGYRASFKFTVVRRKLAGGEKLFFTADALGPQYRDNPESMWGRPLRDFMLNSVRNYFPKATVTSGGTSTITIAEY